MKDPNKPLFWPAWGEMDIGYQPSLAAMAPPPDFRVSNPPMAQAEWNTWFSETLRLINRCLWPSWDFNQRRFPAADETRMTALTRADFDIMEALDKEDIFNRPIESPLRSSAVFSHAEFFKKEDFGNPPGPFHRQYDYSLDPAILAALPSKLIAALNAKAGTTSLQFKFYLQRPRAYQMATHFGLATGSKLFKHTYAISGNTPSMISGHCFQGLAMAGGVIEEWLSLPAGARPSEKSFEALQKWAADFGDRRVYAKVHYPSDNLSSWIVLLRLAPKIYRNPETSRQLWQAIQGSIVYQRIRSSGSKAYQAALAELDALHPAP